jgi:hypothetical protein
MSYHNVDIRTTVENLRKIFPYDKSCGPVYGEKSIYHFECETIDGYSYWVYDYRFDYAFAETEFIDFHIGAETKEICEQAKREMLQAMKDKGLSEEKPRREIWEMTINDLIQKVLNLQNGQAFLRKAISRGIEDKILDRDLIEN